MLFGATGDLAKRKLFPALYHLERRGELKVPVIGVARSDWTDDDFREHAKARTVATGEEVDDEVFGALRQAPLSPACGAFADDRADLGRHPGAVRAVSRDYAAVVGGGR